MPTDDRGAFAEQYAAPLQRAAEHSTQWLRTVQNRPVHPREGVAQALAALGGPLPDGPTDPSAVVDTLVAGGRARADGDRRPAGSSAG